MWLLTTGAIARNLIYSEFTSDSINNTARTVPTARPILLLKSFCYLEFISSWASTCRNPVKKWMPKRESATTSSMRLEKCKWVVRTYVDYKSVCWLLMWLSVTVPIAFVWLPCRKVCELISEEFCWRLWSITVLYRDCPACYNLISFLLYDPSSNCTLIRRSYVKHSYT